MSKSGNKSKTKKNKIFCAVIEILLFLLIMYFLITNFMENTSILKGGEVNPTNIIDSLLSENVDGELKPKNDLIFYRKPYNGSQDAPCYVYISEPYKVNETDVNEKVSWAFPPDNLKASAWNFNPGDNKLKFSWLEIIEK